MTSAVAVSPENKKNPETKRFTLEQYLAREERSKHKHEFYNGEIKIMPGGTTNHSFISVNFTTALKNAIKNSKKKFFVGGSDIGIYIAELDFVLYADALVVFEKVQHKAGTKNLIVNPILIVEVASISTRNFDRADKFEAYKTLPSFKEYILVEQKKVQVESRFIHNPNNWETTIETDLTKNITLRSLGVEISLADVYEDIEF